MAEPDWAKILGYLHENNGEFREVAEESENEEEASHKDHEMALYDGLRKEISLNNPSEEAIVDTHKHLQNTGLVKFETRADYAALILKPDGFEVAHERELTKKQDRTNRVLTFLTAGLLFAAITQAQVAYFQVEPGRRTTFGVALIALALIIVLLLYVYDIA